MSEIRICENCGFHNNIENLECEKCGFDLSFVIPVEEDDINEVVADNLSQSTVEETEHMVSVEESPSTETCCDIGAQNYIMTSDHTVKIEIADGLVIGRDGVAAGILGNRTFVSRKHAFFSIENGSYYITDASTNGTFLNGKKLEKLKATEIQNGDTIRFADVDFEVCLNAD